MPSILLGPSASVKLAQVHYLAVMVVKGRWFYTLMRSPVNALEDLSGLDCMTCTILQQVDRRAKFRTPVAQQLAFLARPII
jgi:hypothetical protein